MEFEPVIVIAGLVLAYALVSARLSELSITGPLVFVAAGVVMGSVGLGMVDGRFDEGFIEILAELTLVVLLFTDATRIDLGRLRRQLLLPVRLIGIGLPITVILGAGVAAVMFTDLGFWEAALLAAVLSPTDAALGQAVVTDHRVPVRIRQALNVESGLNDGLMLPAITVLLAFAAADISTESPGFWVRFTAEQIGFGMIVGAAIGWVGGYLLHRATARGWVEGALLQLATLAIGVGAFATSEAIGGNGFVAAFIAGLAFGTAATEECESAADFSEDEGQLLALLTFLFFGATLVEPAFERLDATIVVYGLLSLTVIRMVPVAISLIGIGLRVPTLAFLGWFGPRGLASILFGLSLLEKAELPGEETIIATVTFTVVASVVLHGLSSVPLAKRYGRWFDEMAAKGAVAEAVQVDEMRTRMG